LPTKRDVFRFEKNPLDLIGGGDGGLRRPGPHRMPTETVASGVSLPAITWPEASTGSSGLKAASRTPKTIEGILPFKSMGSIALVSTAARAGCSIAAFRPIAEVATLSENK
jgi:hypothetical protein